MTILNKNIALYADGVLQSTVLSFILSVFATMLGTDYQMLILIVVGVFVDTVLGIIKHYKLEDLDAYKFITGQVVKLAIVTGNMFIFHAIDYAAHDKGFVHNYLIISGNLSSMLYIAWSVFDNMYIITKKRFPPKFVFDFIKKYFRTGDIKLNSNE